MTEPSTISEEITKAADDLQRCAPDYRAPLERFAVRLQEAWKKRTGSRRGDAEGGRTMSIEDVWQGEISPPDELADEIAAAASRVVRLPFVQPIEVVTVTCSAANRDLIVRALRRFDAPYS